MHGCYILSYPYSFSLLNAALLLYWITVCRNRSFATCRWIILCFCFSGGMWQMPMEHRWYSIWLETPSFFDPKSCSNSCVFFKAIVCEMFTAQNGVIPWPLPISTSPLHLLSPLLPQCWVVWKLEQTNAILISVRTTRSYTKLNYSDAFVLDLNSYDVAIGHRIVLYAFPS